MSVGFSQPTRPLTERPFVAARSAAGRRSPRGRRDSRERTVAGCASSETKLRNTSNGVNGALPCPIGALDLMPAMNPIAEVPVMTAVGLRAFASCGLASRNVVSIGARPESAMVAHVSHAVLGRQRQICSLRTAGPHTSQKCPGADADRLGHVIHERGARPLAAVGFDDVFCELDRFVLGIFSVAAFARIHHRRAPGLGRDP